MLTNLKPDFGARNATKDNIIACRWDKLLVIEVASSSTDLL